MAIMRIRVGAPKTAVATVRLSPPGKMPLTLRPLIIFKMQQAQKLYIEMSLRLRQQHLLMVKIIFLSGINLLLILMRALRKRKTFFCIQLNNLLLNAVVGLISRLCNSYSELVLR